MFSYYGAKTNIIHLYPPPKYGKIIEPFAGSARYALKYWDREVLLVDKYPVVIDIWKWLSNCSEKDILSLPRSVKFGQSLNDINFDCEAQKNFFGFICGAADYRPRMNPTKRKTVERPNHFNYNLQRGAAQIHKIRHWRFICGSYEDIGNEAATWFVDPPYQYGGQSYVMSNKKINFQHLRNWVRDRKGQVIVCENTKADWMDFFPLIKQRGSLSTTTEAIWTNMESSYSVKQIQLL